MASLPELVLAMVLLVSLTSAQYSRVYQQPVRQEVQVFLFSEDVQSNRPTASNGIFARGDQQFGAVPFDSTSQRFGETSSKMFSNGGVGSPYGFSNRGDQRFSSVSDQRFGGVSSNVVEQRFGDVPANEVQFERVPKNNPVFEFFKPSGMRITLPGFKDGLLENYTIHRKK